MAGTQDSNNKKNETPPDPAARRRMFACVLAGELTGFAASMAASHAHLHTHLHVILASTLTGGVLGVLAAVALKPRPPAAKKSEPMRTFTFNGLIETASKKIREMKVDEEFNSASGNSGSQNPKQEQRAQPQLTPPKPQGPGMIGGR